MELKNNFCNSIILNHINFIGNAVVHCNDYDDEDDDADEEDVENTEQETPFIICPRSCNEFLEKFEKWLVSVNGK